MSPPPLGDDVDDALRDAAIAIWREWLVAIHRPRRTKRLQTARNNAILAAGTRHSLALRHDGSIAIWGLGVFGETPRDGKFVAVDAGHLHSLALRVDGSVLCWGHNTHGQAPPDAVEGDFTAIAAGELHSLALRRNGSVACWGRNENGQAPPEGVAGPFDV